MLDWVRACKGGDPDCSDFKVSAPFAEWMVLGVIAFRVQGKLGQREFSIHQQRGSQSLREATVPQRLGTEAVAPRYSVAARLQANLAVAQRRTEE